MYDSITQLSKAISIDSPTSLSINSSLSSSVENHSPENDSGMSDSDMHNANVEDLVTTK